MSPTNEANRLPSLDVDLEWSDVPTAEGNMDDRLGLNWKIWYKVGTSDEKFILGWAGCRRYLDNERYIRWGNGTPTSGGPNCNITLAYYEEMHGNLILEFDPVEDEWERQLEFVNDLLGYDNPCPIGLRTEDRFADAKACRSAEGSNGLETGTRETRWIPRVRESM